MAAHLETCFVCQRSFPFGKGKYHGRYIAQYDMTVCETCIANNWDGLNPRHEKRFEKHLEDRGIQSPARNENGWYDIDIR